ncbi:MULTISPECIES: hypothetical protein [unclassified Diaminobutyricimonas]|uniref:hypothetical protein n=1 Tax=unclassified Diaminobutyricimonas TaxID=2643261 RepID=UPI0018DFA48C|nr:MULTISPECIES: hypothetical protein [unclassified Diaminobutyricimonas]
MNAETTLDPIPASIDNIEFVMISSSGSAVSAESPTRFRYQQKGQMIWGAYIGDTVTIGRFVGRRDGDTVTIHFAHKSVGGGEVTLGTAQSTLRRGDDGRLYLDETFEKDGVAHVSACVDVPPLEQWPSLDAALVSEPRIDGTSFVLESSTASTVSTTAPTRFDFHENSGVIWGSYYGDTVTGGYCVGRYRDGVIDEYFVHHVVATDTTLLGDSSTVMKQRDDGRLELIEEFVLDGVPGKSVCVQLP